MRYSLRLTNGSGSYLAVDQLRFDTIHEAVREVIASAGELIGERIRFGKAPQAEPHFEILDDDEELVFSLPAVIVLAPYLALGGVIEEAVQSAASHSVSVLDHFPRPD
jgi:hypothetical protein